MFEVSAAPGCQILALATPSQKGWFLCRRANNSAPGTALPAAWNTKMLETHGFRMCWSASSFWSMIFLSDSGKGIYTYSNILASLKQDRALKSFISSNQLQLLSAGCICETSQTSGDQIVTTSSSSPCLLDGLPELIAPQEPKKSDPQMVSYVSSISCWAMRRKKNWMKLTETDWNSSWHGVNEHMLACPESYENLWNQCLFMSCFFHPKSPEIRRSLGCLCRFEKSPAASEETFEELQPELCSTG